MVASQSSVCVCVSGFKLILIDLIDFSFTKFAQPIQHIDSVRFWQVRSEQKKYKQHK